MKIKNKKVKDFWNKNNARHINFLHSIKDFVLGHWGSDREYFNDFPDWHMVAISKADIVLIVAKYFVEKETEIYIQIVKNKILVNKKSIEYSSEIEVKNDCEMKEILLRLKKLATRAFVNFNEWKEDKEIDDIIKDIDKQTTK